MVSHLSQHYLLGWVISFSSNLSPWFLSSWKVQIELRNAESTYVHNVHMSTIICFDITMFQEPSLLLCRKTYPWYWSIPLLFILDWRHRKAENTHPRHPFPLKLFSFSSLFLKSILSKLLLMRVFHHRVKFAKQIYPLPDVKLINFTKSLPCQSSSSYSSHHP